MDGQNLTKFYKHIFINKIYIGNVKRLFSQIFNRVAALNWCQKLVFAQYVKNGWTEFNQILFTLYHWQDLSLLCKGSFFTNLQWSYSPWLMSEIVYCSIYWEWMDRILTKFCTLTIIDKVWVGIINCHFSQICNRVKALHWCQKLVFAQ